MPFPVLMRPIVIPDLTRVARFERAPDLGPKILFFSGGTALNGVSRVLKTYTHNSIHLVTPFDSGGSSASLRYAFGMPAIGDVRSRIMALADETLRGTPEVYRLFSTRLPKDEPQQVMAERLRLLADGQDPRVADVKKPVRRQICQYLTVFMKAMPKNFDLRGASIGNLILTGGYIATDGNLDRVITRFSKLVGVLGEVVPVTHEACHLMATLEDGATIVGQHLLTGKEHPPITSPVQSLTLVRSLNKPTVVPVTLPKSRRKRIKTADLICYPPGSFYSSLIANLLPKGVGASIAKSQAPKVYVPNLGQDPESLGVSLDNCVDIILATLRKDCTQDIVPTKLMNFVLLDSAYRRDVSPATKSRLKELGITVLDARLVSAKSQPYYDPQLLSAALLSLT